MEESESLLEYGYDKSCFKCLRRFFFISCFFFFDLESDEDVFDDESDDDGSGSGFTSGLCLSWFFYYPLIVLVDCHVIKSPNLVVVLVEYFQFPAQKLL